MKRSPLVVVLFVALALPTAAQVPDLTRNDSALISHIKRTDTVFSKLLDLCTSEHLARSKENTFTYTASCTIKPVPEDDCYGYKVTAFGTVDNKTWATVRTLQLSLQCSA